MKKHGRYAWLAYSIPLVLLETLLHLFYGYYVPNNALILLGLGAIAFIRYGVLLIGLFLTLYLVVKRQYEKIVIGLSLFLLIFSFIPKTFFENISALLSVYGSDPYQVLSDARLLENENPPLTCIGYSYQRYPCNNPISRSELPASIRNVHVRNVLIFDNYVVMEKFGLFGVFSGFVAFQSGSDVWKDEQRIVVQSDCNTCLKIRIIDGLYWYQANPSDPPIFVSILE
ncbi:MAG: hypothetical protein AB1607_14475 [Chloroflexota bacterium]